MYNKEPIQQRSQQATRHFVISSISNSVASQKSVVKSVQNPITHRCKSNLIIKSDLLCAFTNDFHIQCGQKGYLSLESCCVTPGYYAMEAMELLPTPTSYIGSVLTYDKSPSKIALYSPSYLGVEESQQELKRKSLSSLKPLFLISHPPSVPFGLPSSFLLQPTLGIGC